ncbi:hypothetical protein PENTCL1PPCAC_15464, partial [Pristionchus entomophagus]
IQGGFVEATMSACWEVYELCLDTKVWTIRDAVVSQAIRTELRSGTRWECHGVVRGRMHLRLHIIGGGEADNVYLTSLQITGHNSMQLASPSYPARPMRIYASGSCSPLLSTMYRSTLVIGTRVFFIDAAK